MFISADGGTGARYIATHDGIGSYDCECRETFARMFGSFLQCALCVCVDACGGGIPRHHG